MEVEMFIGHPDKTWNTAFVTIPDDTPKEKINDVAADTMLRKLEEDEIEVAFVGVFHYNESEEKE